MKTKQSYLNIAKHLFAKQFRFFKQDDSVYLFTEQENPLIEYVIKKDEEKYLVIQFKDKQSMKNILNLKSDNELFNYIYDNFGIFLTVQQLYNDVNYFDKKELYQYFVIDKNIGLNDFRYYFDIDCNYGYEKITINNCTIEYINKIDQYLLKSIKNLIVFLSKEYKKIFSKKIYIEIDDKIINGDNIKTNGNNILNKNGFEINIRIDLQNSVYVLCHQFGHSFEELYLNKQYVDQLFLKNKNYQLFQHPQNLFKRRSQFIPQIFAEYYTGNPDNNFKFNFKKYILDKI